MPYRTDVVFVYDGTADGLLTCIFESYARKIIPIDIQPEGSAEPVLFDVIEIPTVEEKARRVEQGIRSKLGQEALDLIQNGILTCHPHKELVVLRYVRLGLREGQDALNRLADDTVHSLHKAVQGLNREVNKWMGFIRFSAYGQVLVAEIEPLNEVLPLLAPHFCDRYEREAFLIYDRTHKKALVHRPGEHVIMEVDELTLPEASRDEEAYRTMWQRFYETIAIQERINPRGRMNHMPKRYWKHLTEMASPRIAESADAVYLVGKDSAADDSSGIEKEEKER
ncbi:TIGR03915 family putative DNA repair protein [Gorillibacterium timonense]|uniref:TIGR03915 family putative DNA repair protein n=1 Tax=Gorillibacterium timonense TaxID=1689269 RepID=UPI0009EBD47D|nr:TIGR03915 family putative DNA repair protein [Gorillibacterium timonense]